MSINEFAGRGRCRIERARANGYLNANTRSSEALLKAHGFWCWRFRLPLIWYERKSPRSRHGRVCLDLFTTPYVLTARGLEELGGIADRLELTCHAFSSPFEYRWEDVPMARLEELSRAVFRTVTRLGNFELSKRSPAPALARMMEAITASKPVRISA